MIEVEEYLPNSLVRDGVVYRWDIDGDVRHYFFMGRDYWFAESVEGLMAAVAAEEPHGIHFRAEHSPLAALWEELKQCK